MENLKRLDTPESSRKDCQVARSGIVANLALRIEHPPGMSDLYRRERVWKSEKLAGSPDLSTLSKLARFDKHPVSRGQMHVPSNDYSMNNECYDNVFCVPDKSSSNSNLNSSSIEDRPEKRSGRIIYIRSDDAESLC
jgi:hypothetical protein